MYTIKPLRFRTNPRGTVYAEPHGLMWMYYITPVEGGNFELSLINEYGETNSKLWIFCNSLDKAKKLANKHYVLTLTKLLLKS